MCLAVLVGACGSDDPASDAPLPRSADSGFVLQANAFAFENFAVGYSDSQMTPELVARMFGDEDVCMARNPTCVLTAPARTWMNKTNAAMAGGRCEGFAVLSELLYSGAIASSKFGGSNARELTLDGNVPLQQELAYWFATQGVPSAITTRKLAAKDALRFLSTFLKPDATEFYRIGMVRKTKKGIAGGHAVIPIRYEESATPGVYTVHVYDNNFPDTDRTMTIDVNEGRWEYRASANPDEPAALYYGDAANGNLLYLASIHTREGKLAAPFGKSATDTQVTFQGAVNATASDGAGNTAGINADGAVVETGGATVSPSFSAVSTWSLSPPTLLILPSGTTTTIDIGAGNGESTTPGTVTAAGAGWSVSASQLAPTSADLLAITDGGTTASYTNHSGTPLTLVSAVKTDGASYEIQIDVPAGGTMTSVHLDTATGQITTGITTGGSADSEIQIGVTRTGTDGNAVQASGTVTVKPGASATLRVDGAAIVADRPLAIAEDGATCTDGARNGAETDVDCGGACAQKCVVGKSCAVAGDCTTGACDAGRCSTPDSVVFVTSGTTTGDIGGLAGADARCQAAATSARLPGTYLAMLSSPAVAATSRILRGPARYVLPDGVTVVAASAGEFFSPTHLGPIDRTEANVAIGSVEVWTASAGGAEADGSEACVSWTSATSDSRPYSGLSNATDERWLSAATSECSGTRHLYCVQQGTAGAP